MAQLSKLLCQGTCENKILFLDPFAKDAPKWSLATKSKASLQMLSGGFAVFDLSFAEVPKLLPDL